MTKTTFYYDLFLELNQELADNPYQRLKLHFQEYTDFQCNQCAQCCRTIEKVCVSSAYLDKWHAVFLAREPQRFAQAFGHLNSSPASAQSVLGRNTLSNACVFLDDDNLCWIQKNYSHEALPQICQVYPRFQTQLGENLIYQSLQNNCQTVPQLWTAPSQLAWQFQTTERPLSQAELTYIQTYQLWLGIALDTFMLYPPLSALYYLTRLHQIFSQNHWEFIPASLNQLQQEWLLLPNEDYHPLDFDPKDLESYLKWLQPQIKNTHLNPLSEFVRDFLNAPHSLKVISPLLRKEIQKFLTRFLLQETLSARLSLQDGLNLVQQHMMFVFQATLFQLQIQYHLEVNMQVNAKELSHMINQQTFFFAQRQSQLQENYLAKQSIAACLEKSLVFLALDFGLA